MNKRILIIGAAALLIVFIMLFIPKNKGDEPVVTTDNPVVEQSAKALYNQALTFKKDGELLKAKNAYKQILMNHPDFENIDAIQRELETLNMKILFSNMPTERTVIHEVQSGDTLGEIAKKYKTTIDLIKRSNHLTSDIIRIGQKLRIWTGTFNIFVDKSQNILMLKEGEEVVKVYNVSTGSNASTPVGAFKITSKLVDPVWFNKGVVLPPESPQNVLGTRWLGFDTPGYGIHGTIEPETIGQPVTAGCVRMRNEDVEELFSIVPLGTEVVITN